MDPLTFYFDRCFGKRFPYTLRRVKPPFTVEYHHDPKNQFPQEMPDDEWLSIVGARGWLAFSHDGKFHNEAAPCAAIKQHGIGCFYLWGANASPWEKLRCFARNYRGIVKLAASSQRPFIYRVNANCRIREVRIP